MNTGNSYDLAKFLNEIRMKPENVFLVDNVDEDAKNQLRLYGKQEILDFITSIPKKNFIFVNSKEYNKGIPKKGTAGNMAKMERPMVDSYIIEFRFQTNYISFGFSNYDGRWFIKSLHADKGETVSIGDLSKQLPNLI